MPYIRSITFIFFIAALIFPIIGDTYPLDFVLYVILFSLFIWLLALLNDFLSSLIALILSAFFTQRMLILYLDPTVFSYQWVTNEEITLSVLFCLFAVIGIYFGSLTFSLASDKPQNIVTRKTDIHFKSQTFRTLVGNIDINSFITVSSYLVLIGLSINIYFAITSGIGIASITADRGDVGINLSFIEKLFTRIGPFFTYLMMFILTVFVKKDSFSKRTILLAYFTTFIYILYDLVIVTSKGTFIWLAFTLLIINQLVKGHVSKVIVRRAAYVVIVSVVFLFALIGILRPVISDYFLSGGINVDRLLYGVEITFFDTISQFSNRLSAFDWLAGIMAYQGDLFSYSGTFWPQMSALINSYFPGELIQEPDYMEMSRAMPIYLDNQPINTTTRELPGGLSIMFLSFGWGSCFVYYLMTLLLRLMQASNLHIFYKLIIYSNFTLGHFTGGLGTFIYLTDRILAIIIGALIVKILIYFVRDFNRYLIVR